MWAWRSGRVGGSGARGGLGRIFSTSNARDVIRANTGVRSCRPPSVGSGGNARFATSATNSKSSNSPSASSASNTSASSSSASSSSVSTSSASSNSASSSSASSNSKKWFSNVPGILGSIAVMQASFSASEFLGHTFFPHQAASPISGVSVALLSGLLLNTVYFQALSRASPPAPTSSPSTSPSSSTVPATPAVAAPASTSAAASPAAALSSTHASPPASSSPSTTTAATATSSSFDALKPGLQWCTTTALRAGIVLIGFKLSAMDVLTLGLGCAPVIAASVASGMFFVPYLASKFGLARNLGLLLAAGTSICGVTAVVSVAPTIQASKQEVAVAVANVAAFGLLGMLVYPYLAHHFFASSSQVVGLFLGTAIHDTSQVMGAAMSYRDLFGDELVLKMAAVTKLSRNLLLAVVVPGLAWWTSAGPAAPTPTSSSSPSAAAAVSTSASAASGSAVSASAPHASSSSSSSSSSAFSNSTSQNRLTWKVLAASFRKFFPTFVLGFVGAAVLRTCGDMSLAEFGQAFGCISAADWRDGLKMVDQAGVYCLGTAMAAVGLGTHMSIFRGVGWRPFCVGFLGCLAVGSVGLASALLLVGSPPQSSSSIATTTTTSSARAEK